MTINRTSKNKIKEYFLFFTFLILGLLLAEFALSLFDKKSDSESNFSIFPEESDYPSRYYAESKKYGFQPIPGKHRAIKLSKEGRPIYDIEYTIGEDRFRVTPNQNDSGDLLRVNLFGGSFAIGEGVEDYETVAYYIRKYLTKIGIEADIKNYGSHGFGVHQALRIMDLEARESDLNIILTAPFHAERMTCDFGESASGNPLYKKNDGVVSYWGNCGDLRDKGYDPALPKAILDYRRNNISNLLKLTLRAIKAQTYEEYQTELLEFYIEMLAEMHRRSTISGVPLLVAYMKAPELLVGEINDELITQNLLQRGLNLVDVTLASTYSDAALKIHNEEGHPSRETNERRASLIVDYIKKKFPTITK